MDKYRICSRHFFSGKPAKTLDETNIDWALTLHPKRQQRSQTVQLERFERARRRTENQQQQEEERETVGREVTEESISQLVEEIDSDVVEGFWMKTAAIEAVVEMNQ